MKKLLLLLIIPLLFSCEEEIDENIQNSETNCGTINNINLGGVIVGDYNLGSQIGDVILCAASTISYINNEVVNILSVGLTFMYNGDTHNIVFMYNDPGVIINNTPTYSFPSLNYPTNDLEVIEGIPLNIEYAIYEPNGTINTWYNNFYDLDPLDGILNGYNGVLNITNISNGTISGEFEFTGYLDQNGGGENSFSGSFNNVGLTTLNTNL